MEVDEEMRLINMEYLRNMMMGMRYQNGLEIDTDNMTYEQLLELEEQMGSVSKGIPEAQFNLLPIIQNPASNADPCPICYEALKEGEEVLILPC